MPQLARSDVNQRSMAQRTAPDSVSLGRQSPVYCVSMTASLATALQKIIRVNRGWPVRVGPRRGFSGRSGSDLSYRPRLVAGHRRWPER
jgi:hypothetical protein